MRKHDLISSAIWFFVSLLILFSAPKLGFGSLSVPGSGFMPFLAGAFICLFSIATFLSALFTKGEEKVVLWGNINYFKLVTVLVLLLVYIFVIDYVGFLVGTFLLILLLMHFLGSLRWLPSLFGAFATTICCYFIFDVWLRTNLPKGVIMSWVS